MKKSTFKKLWKIFQKEIKDKKDKVEFEKSERENEIRKYQKDQCKDKLQSDKLFRMNYEIENLKKDYESKNKECATMTDKYKTSLKDSENFVHLVTSEIGQFTNFLESLNTSTKAIMEIPLTMPENFKVESNYGNNYSLKFEVIIKSINQLKHKVQDIIQGNTNAIQKFKANIYESEEEIQKCQNTPKNLKNSFFSRILALNILIPTKETYSDNWGEQILTIYKYLEENENQD